MSIDYSVSFGHGIDLGEDFEWDRQGELDSILQYYPGISYIRYGSMMTGPVGITLVISESSVTSDTCDVIALEEIKTPTDEQLKNLRDAYTKITGKEGKIINFASMYIS